MSAANALSIGVWRRCEAMFSSGGSIELSYKKNDQTKKPSLSIWSKKFKRCKSGFVFGLIFLYATFCRQKSGAKTARRQVFGFSGKNFLKQTPSRFYFVKSSLFLNGNFPACPISENLPTAMLHTIGVICIFFNASAPPALRNLGKKGVAPTEG
ncbi:MAG: hypothetical protein J6Q29_01070 [Alistipes sp.]|nr:hypothetical protein [Alistipes sp.]